MIGVQTLTWMVINVSQPQEVHIKHSLVSGNTY